MYPFDYFQHQRACQRKQQERAARLATLPSPYLSQLSPQDRHVLDKPVEELVQDVRKGLFRPIDILRGYGKAAVAAHHRTNCLTEVMISEAEGWAEGVNVEGPLAGIPVSLKDTVIAGGFDASVGYSSLTGHPHEKDGPMVRILRDAGAIPYVKTAVPITLLSFESTNDVWGRCTNPHNTAYSPGGSTGGEAALIALGGSRIGIGSDVAGSVRVPAHFSGIYALRCSIGRWPKAGIATSMPGQEGVPSVYSPMARTLGDLTYFTRSIIGMKPWTYDYSVHPLDWREAEARAVMQSERLRIGVMRDDGVVPPSPACARALAAAADALSSAGHDVFDVSPPLPYEGLLLASRLLNADGCATFRSFFRAGETNDPGASALHLFSLLPAPLKYLWYLWTKYVRRDPLWAELLREFRALSAAEQWRLVARREAYRARWHAWWTGAELDFLLTVPNATPALPHDAMKSAVSSCGYTFLFNLLDYTAGVLPVLRVDRALDALPASFRLSALNGVARGAYEHYDATAMHGLPVGVQLVGQRLTEERVLAGMRRVEDGLEEFAGGKYGASQIE
ncbi:MAG: hypothetical protein M1832_005454 [Thelocarpon impressellum]|nr:MAG: hypothetical protein M1832_005454 [Thelocarpon impressellum]